MADVRIERGDGWELRCCDWRDADGGWMGQYVDHVITDPPYGARTHAGQSAKTKDGSHRLAEVGDLGYEAMDEPQARSLCKVASAHCDGWVLLQTSHDVAPWYEDELRHCGRYVFAPLPIVTPGANVRLAGDGPSSWTVWMVVSRSTIKKCWSTKPGYYQSPKREDNGVMGSKALGLMEAIVLDYTDRGDLVCDPYAGSGTTGVACIRNGRRFLGWERKPEHFEIACKRLRATREQMGLAL